MVKAHFMAVAIDETSYFNIGEDEAPYIDKIFAVYAYDKNEVTRLCELDTSYYLHGVHHVVALKDGTPEHMVEIIHDKYESEYPDNIYRGSWRVDDMASQVDLSKRFADEDDNIEDVVEYLQGNHLW